MANVSLYNSDVPGIDLAMPVIASLAPTLNTQPGDPTTTASYYTLPPYIQLEGTGFSYDTLGRLSGGTVTSISLDYPQAGSGSSGSSVGITGTSVPVATLLSLFGRGQSVVPVLLAGNNTFTTNSTAVVGSAGDDLINVVGPGDNQSHGVYIGQPPVDFTLTSVDGAGGENMAAFASLRSAATIVNGGGDENVFLPNLTADLVLIDRLQFIDGTTYETNASAGAQAALMFEGIFGRLPDAINAGGFALVAQESGVVAAAAQMLATAEGSGNTAGLSNTQFVTRLYANVLHRAPEAEGLAGWQADLDNGQLTRAEVTARFAAAPEAQSVNAAAFDSGTVFGANPNAVEVLRAYETLLGRTPEAASVVFDTNRLGNGTTLQQFYTEVQDSAEFASRGPNAYGITGATSYAAVFGIAHSDPVNTLVTSLVTGAGVAHQ